MEAVKVKIRANRTLNCESEMYENYLTNTGNLTILSEHVTRV